MSAYSPSNRMKGDMEEELNLNLNSMMDMFAVLIPALLMMSAAVEVAVLNVVAPSISADDSPPPENTDVPVNFTVTITDTGYILSAEGVAMVGENNAPTLPLKEVALVCSRYRGTKPPPRLANKDRPICPQDAPMEKRSFLVYDVAALTRKTSELKDKYPNERRIIIAPSANSEYEEIVDVMDATRDVLLPDGNVKPMFDEVVISPPAIPETEKK